ncbi:uncharacterized protein LOC125663853 isoform X2 [Ostrea edulis]|nr:uncharacterized protein LOC125663853 isoform X2 [Ostrea edulis]
MRVFMAYLEETEVDQKFRDLVKQLFSLQRLPYNPYPGFVMRFSGLEEKFLLNLTDGTLIHSLLNTDFDSSYLDGLVSVRGCNNVWGLSNIISAVSPAHLQKYSWLVADLSNFPGLSRSMSLSLVGPAVFEGTYYSEIHVPQFRLEMTINQTDLTLGIEEFADGIISHMKDLDKRHYVMDIHIPHLEKMQFVDKWDLESLQKDKKEFVQAVNRAVLNHLYPMVDCVFSLDRAGERSTAGQVQYAVNFQHPLEGADSQEGVRLPEAGTPMLSMYDGVYLEKRQAEYYLGLFTQDQRDKAGYSGVKDAGGFTSTNEVVEGVRNYLNKKIAGCLMYAEFSEAIYWSIVLFQMDRASYPIEIAEELLKLCNSSLGKICVLWDQCKSLVLLTKAQDAEGKFTKEIGRQLEDYRKTTALMFDTSLIERNHSMKCFGDILVSRITQFISGDYTAIELHRGLYAMYFYIQGMVIQVSENLKDCCPVLTAKIFIVAVGEHRDAQPKPIFTVRQRPDANGGVKHEADVVHGMEDEKMKDLEHERMIVDVEANGSDYNQLIKVEGVLMQYAIDSHLDETWHSFLTILQNKESLPPNPYPTLISLLRKQAMKMDLIYQPKSHIMKSLFQTSPSSEEKKGRQEDKQSDVYIVNGVDAHGLLSSVYVLDTGGFAPIYEAIQPLIYDKTAERRKQFTISVSTAMSGPGILYGKTQPYLKKVDLHEHYYIQGPADQRDNAIQIFASMVETHILELIKKNTVPVLGMYFPTERWSWETILNRYEKGGFSAFASTICRHAQQKKTFYMKALVMIDWRYVTAEKYFLLHYLTDKFIKPELSYPESGITIYQTVFFSKANAQFHRRNGQLEYSDIQQDVVTVEECVDQLIVIGAQQNEWLEVHRGLLLKNLLRMVRDDEPLELVADLDEFEVLTQEEKHIVEAWYVLHSMAAQMEYVIAFTSTLQDLTQLFIEMEKFKVKNDKYLATITKEEKPPTPIKERKKKEKERKKQEKLVKEMREKEKAKKINLLEKRKMTVNEEKSKEGHAGEEELWEEEFEKMDISDRTVPSKQTGFVPIEEFKISIDEAMFSRMVMIYWRKLMQVLSAKIFMVSPSLRNYLELRLSPCLEDDPQSGNFYLSYTQQTVERLEEIKHILHSVQDILACDVHMICPEAQSLIQELKSKYPN